MVQVAISGTDITYRYHWYHLTLKITITVISIQKHASNRKSEESSAPDLELLTAAVYGKNASKIECDTIEYCIALSDPSAFSLRSYVNYVLQHNSNARSRQLVRAWTTLQSHVTKYGPTNLQNARIDATTLTVTDATRFLKEARAAHNIPGKKNGDKATIREHDLPKTEAAVSSSRHPITRLCVSNPISSNSNNSSNTSSLSVNTLNLMRERYQQNYMSYTGESWKLPSGTVVDEAIRALVMDMKKESTLQSFIIDTPKVVIDLFDGVDRATVAQQLTGNGTPKKIDMELEMTFLSTYLQAPDATQKALSRGWHAEKRPLEDGTRYWLYTSVLQLHRVYKQVGFKLPTGQSESWYMTQLMAFLPELICAGNAVSYLPGEVQSKASAQRKNADRTLSAKRVQGRKIDGLFICQKTEFEIGALEAARTDEDMQATKALSDTRKLGKLMKDMFDCIRAKASDEVEHDLITFGIQVSRARITFFSLQKLAGRYFYMKNDGSFALPLVWDDEPESAEVVLCVLNNAMQLKARMEEMAKKVRRWTRTGPPNGFDRDVTVSTLPSPIPSPKSERSSYF
ncbi:hypothetical protein BGZ94_004632 [Podila epigama]|nr:hypothetical protein BGZ94_004632 [Podila epigama]